MKPTLKSQTAQNSQTMFLNIGCGNRFSRDARWVNIDLFPAKPEVRSVDATSGLPFEDNSFAVTYHSHVLEHLDRQEGRKLLCECLRVLRPGGVLRVVVPDLERIALSYLERLVEARTGGKGAHRRHTWAVLELFDQMTRRRSGGDMIEFLADSEPEGRSYAELRCGAETRSIIATLDCPLKKIEEPAPRRKLRILARSLCERIIRSLLGKEYSVLKIGRFAVAGELHRWMYDSFSLTSILTDLGFSLIQVRSSVESYVDEWPKFELDADASGVTHKPDSLFVEAIKPRIFV